MGANSAHVSVVDGASAGSPEFEDHGDSRQRGGAPASIDGVDDGFVVVYEAHYPRLVRALELSGANRATAEDVAQEAFARTLWHWNRVRRGTNPSGYVYRIAFRLLRRDRNRNQTFTDQAPSPDIAIEVALWLEIERAIQAMPLAQRRCAVLCLVIGASTRDAARALGIAESTVRKQIERARSDLGHVLDAPV